MEESGEIENRSPLPLFGYYYVHTYYRIPLMWLSIHPWLNNGFDDYSHLFYRTIGPKLFWILNWICKLYFTGHFLIFVRLKFETILNFSWNHKILGPILLSIALGLLVLDRWKPNDWKLGERYYIPWKLKPCSSAQGPWAQAKVTPIFCDAATTLEVGKILSDSSHVTLLDHRWLDKRSVWVGLTPCRLL